MDYNTGYFAIAALINHYRAPIEAYSNADSMISRHQERYEHFVNGNEFGDGDLSPQEAFNFIVDSVLGDVFIMSGVGTIDEIKGFREVGGFLDSLSPEKLLATIYPEGGVKADIEAAIKNGSISGAELAFGTTNSIADGNPTPSLNEIQLAASEALGTQPPEMELDFGLVPSGLSFPGLDEAQLDFLVAMYIGSFGRAPEYDGLEYWAGETAKMLKSGMDFDAVAPKIGQFLYDGGLVHNEKGTNLNTQEFVTLAYQNALGREPDTEGHAYWVGEIDAGNISRGHFMTYFVDGALAYEDDGGHIAMSVAVAKHIAQEHITGDIAKEDEYLLFLVNDIEDQDSAAHIIDDLMNDYPMPELTGISYEATYDFA